MKNKKIVFILIPLFVLIVFFLNFNRQEEAQEFYYIATLNGIRIPLSEYKLYLREQIISFESIGGGTYIWKTNFDGIPAQVVAKQRALDAIIFVKLIIEYADIIGVYLTPEDKKEAVLNAEILFDSFTPQERQDIDFYVVVNTMKEMILQTKVFDEITRNYTLEEERAEVFHHIYELWLQDAEIEKNIQVWDSIIIIP